MVLEMARELGIALANSPEFARMKSAQAIVEENAALQTLITEFKAKREAICQLMVSADAEKDLIVQVSADMERLQAQLLDNALFFEMNEAEKAFTALLHSVDREINVCIGSENEAHGCTDDCASCEGCNH